MTATRVYAAVLFLVIAGVAAGELQPRGDAARLSSSEPSKRHARMRTALRSAEERIARGEVEPGDAETLAELRPEAARLGREARIRTAQTGAILGLAVASLLFAAVTLPAVLRDPKRGRAVQVELEPDEVREVDPVDVPSRVASLFASRQEAIAHLLAHPELRCGYCGTAWRPERVGRIGRRVFMRRKPPGVTLEQELGAGWWARPSAPPPCAKCGGTDLVPG